MRDERITNKRRIKEFIFVLLVFLIASFFSTTTIALTIHPDIVFKVENEEYTVSNTMIFEQITIDSSYIIFNTTGFYVDSANDIAISLDYLHNYVQDAKNGNIVLAFYANTIGGNVWFNLSGFPFGWKYIVYRGSNPIAYPTANNADCISFSNNVWSTQYFEILQLSSNKPPFIDDPSPVNSSTGISVSTSLLCINIEDADGDTFNWSIITSPNVGSISVNVASNGSKFCNITGLDYSTSYTWYVNANDGNVWTNKSYYFTTEAAPSEGGTPGGGFEYIPPIGDEENNPPDEPLKPSGPTFIELGVDYNYYTQAYDSDGDMLRYRFDWGDGNISDWSQFIESDKEISFTRSWSATTSYDIRVIAQDEHGINSSWSEILTVAVSQSSEEEPPIAEIVKPLKSMVNQTITFDASSSYDPDGVIVSYVWDFGDGEVGSGISTVHIYKNPGVYTVTLIVTDNNGNTYNNSIIVNVASEFQELKSEKKQSTSSFVFIMVLVVFAVSIIICLASVFRNRIGFILLQHKIQRIKKFKDKLRK